ncbi:hypothetical protein ELUMI_v1c02380 [Williamsoniiplasma luminosum]|uniref:HAD family phosphatase n=1 Tax=Williamsoniiplasma luminosum TaxID=214888 RepID=A0A2K8NWG6_9MOLU|nr:Cof-type HAD-IIB family hydrolase [Williamsoniiplasma luminosum]ATZ16963.1 hypothetical protein ELUMI_v1c02380 [Williamsoniiplasma luminosum]
MKIKAIVLDIDGTLITNERIISSGTKKALIQAQRDGIKVILASGRPTPGMMEFAKELELDKNHGFLISYNGAVVTDLQTNEIIYEKTLSAEQAQNIIAHLKEFNVLVMLYKGDYVYVENAYYEQIAWNGHKLNIVEHEAHGCDMLICEVKDLVEFADFPMYKVLSAGQSDYLRSVEQELRAPFIGKANSMFTSDFFYEYTAIGIDKANALKSFLPQLGIDPENLLAFGDGQNDMSMLEYAGIGVAMGNAREEVQNVADFVTKTNNEDGIVHALNKYLKND